MKIFILLFLFSILAVSNADTQITVINKCSFTIWVGIQSREGSKSKPNYPLPHNGGWELPSGESSDVYVPYDLMGGRIWGRTGCDSSGRNCATGDCGALECAGKVGALPATLAEFGLSEWNGLDFYDISLVDGFNLPMSFYPKSKYPGVECPFLKCLNDVNAICPEDLKVYSQGKSVACMSSCVKYHKDSDCCINAFDNPQCPKSPSASIFKNACPDAYSYAKDDTSTKACKQTGYNVVFCDGSSPGPSPSPMSPSGIYAFSDFDISGNDIGSVQKSVWSDCFAACYEKNGCKSFSWNDYNGGTCWLKATSDKDFLRPGVSSVISAFLCQLNQEKDIKGNDIGSKQALDPKECCAICSFTKGCGAFSWNNYQGGTCWLKSGGVLFDQREVISFSA